ncbi:hypothetical protein M5D96_009933, partial [Drosophila gunungcola]
MPQVSHLFKLIYLNTTFCTKNAHPNLSWAFLLNVLLRQGSCSAASLFAKWVPSCFAESLISPITGCF